MEHNTMEHVEFKKRTVGLRNLALDVLKERVKGYKNTQETIRQGAILAKVIQIPEQKLLVTEDGEPLVDNHRALVRQVIESLDYSVAEVAKELKRRGEKVVFA